MPHLAEATKKVANRHPALNFVVSEYADLVAQPFDKLDVGALWAVGTGLLANREAFARPADPRNVTDPLEPSHLALLQQAAEIHGGLILGFEKGRELTENADTARLSPDVVETISAPAQSILEKLRHDGKRVEDGTKRFIAAIEESLIVHGWQASRLGHAGYVLTRNSLIAIGRVLLRGNSALATVLGSIGLNEVDPGLVQTKLWLEFVIDNGRTIMAFAEPFRELKIWFQSIIDQIDREKRTL